MPDVYVVCNQLNQFWGKKKRWVDGSKPRDIAVFKHEDEGLNQLVELSARDVELRGRVDAAATDERGIPDVVPSEHRIIDEEELAKQASEDDTQADEANPRSEDAPLSATSQHAAPADAPEDIETVDAEPLEKQGTE